MTNGFVDGRARRGRLALRRILIVGGTLAALLLLARETWEIVEIRRLGALRRDLEGAFGPLDPGTLAPPEGPAADNQARFLRAAAELVDVEMMERRSLRRLAESEGGAPAEVEAKVRANLERNREVLDLVEVAARRPASNWEIDYPKGMHARLPNLLKLVDMSRLIHARAALDLAGGDPGGAVRWLRLDASLWQSLRDEPVLFLQILRLSRGLSLLARIRTLLARSEPTGESLEGLKGIVDALDARSSMRRGLLGELKCDDAGFRIMTAEGGGPAMGQGPGGVLGWLLRPALRRAHREVLADLKGAIEDLDKPRERRSLPATVPFEERSWFDRAFTAWAINDWRRVIERADVVEGGAALGRIAIALRLFRVAHGAYPESLDRLVPSYLAAVPTDPFSGSAPEYVLDGAGFVLRSAGSDQEVEGHPLLSPRILEWRIPR